MFSDRVKSKLMRLIFWFLGHTNFASFQFDLVAYSKSRLGCSVIMQVAWKAFIASRLGGELLRYIRETKVWFLTVRPLKNRNRGPSFQEPDIFVITEHSMSLKNFLSTDFYVNYFQYNKIEIRPPCNKSRKIAWPRGWFFPGLGLFHYVTLGDKGQMKYNQVLYLC